jgi:ABC-type phosphate/phosphonate transport system substrate-binding protein
MSTTEANGNADESSKVSKPRLRLITYLHPGIPLELFQVYQRYIETVLGCGSYLIVESRWSAPPTGVEDPFTADDVDIAFMCSTGYVRMLSERNQFMELLPVAPLYDHPKADRRPVYFSEVIIRKEKADIYKDLMDLRGHRWATNDIESLSGHLSVLSEVKKLGFNASFFGHILHAESHVDSINLVLNNIADMAAIDSNTLQLHFKEHPEDENELHTLTTLGPWPIQPIIVNARLSADVKSKIANALRHVMDHPEYGVQFEKFGVKGFEEVDSSFYDRTREVMDFVKDRNLYPTYY